MRLKIKWLADGPGHGEVLIAVTTLEGYDEQVIVHPSTIVDETIEIGYPIHREDDTALVELPRETMSGRWRIWVSKESIAA